VSRVLKAVVIPFDRTYLEWLGDNQLTIFVDTRSVLNEFDLQSLINYCIALKEVFQGCISPLSFCDFRCCQRVLFVLFAAISKHFIHMKAVSFRWRAALIVALPMVRKQLPLLRTQFLRFHTKHCMGVIVGCIELGIIIQSQDYICYCIVYPFDVDYFGGIFLQE
jgi:hypothetical protein